MIWNVGIGLWNVFTRESILWIPRTWVGNKMGNGAGCYPFTTAAELVIADLPLRSHEAQRLALFPGLVQPFARFKLPKGDNVPNTLGQVYSCNLHGTVPTALKMHWLEIACFVSIWPQMTCTQGMPCTLACCCRCCTIIGKWGWAHHIDRGDEGQCKLIGWPGLLLNFT